MPTESKSRTAESAHDSTVQDSVTPDAPVRGRKRRKGRTTLTSKKKIESNRRNALRSTGPRTKKGKQHSRRNALVLGIYAGPQVLPGESQNEYAALLAALEKDLLPRGPIEQMVVTGIAGDIWRRKRVALAEYAVISKQVFARAEQLGDRDAPAYVRVALRDVLGTIACQQYDVLGENIRRQSKTLLSDILEKLDTLQGLQKARSIEVQPRLSEHRAREAQGPRLLTATTEDDSNSEPDDESPPPFAPRRRGNIAQSD